MILEHIGLYPIRGYWMISKYTQPRLDWMLHKGYDAMNSWADYILRNDGPPLGHLEPENWHKDWGTAKDLLIVAQEVLDE